jgi:Family of unknown function (DUF6760)
MRLPAEQVWDDVTYLAYHLHWELDTILDLEHPDRRRIVAGVSALNDRAWSDLRAHEAGS